VAVEDASYGSKIVASIDIEPLMRLAPQIAELVKPSGRMGVSGVVGAENGTA
jgi:ribosomal protein L11 methylase PrmA